MAADHSMDHSYEMTNHPPIYEGATFSSLAEFQNALSKHMQQTNTVYIVAKSQCIQQAQLMGVSSLGYKTKYAPLSPDLKYSYALYGCKHYGITRSKSKGIRPNQKTFKTDCPSRISIMTDRKRGLLVVKTAVLEHNHHLGPDMAQLYPENRRMRGVGGTTRSVHVRNLPPVFKSLRDNMLTTVHPGDETPPRKVAKVNPANECFESTSDNIEVVSSSPPVIESQEDGDTGLENCLELLREEYDCNVEVLMVDGECKGLMVQDKAMVQAFNAFPRCLCMDVTGSLLQVPVYVVLLTVESSAGLSDVAALGVLLSEDEESVAWLLTAFKLTNKSSEQTRLIFNNWSSEHGDVLKSHFPECILLLNPAVCLKSWKRDVPRGMTGVTEDGEDLGIHLLKRAINSTSSAELEGVYSEMKSALPPNVLTYYDEYWHVIHEQWTINHTFKPDFMASAAKLTEHYKRKLGLRSGVSSSSAVFFQRFFTELDQQRTEYNNNSLKSVSKMPCVKNEDLTQYSTLLTPYAYSFVVAQAELMETCKPFDFIGKSGNKQGTVSVPISSCLCPFYVTLALPCCHIFVRRRFLGLDTFDVDLCDKQWTKEYFITVTRQRQTVETEPKKPLSKFQKLCKANDVTAELGRLLSHSSDEVFTKRMSLLQHLLQAWQNGEEIAVENLEEGSDPMEVEVEQQGVYKLLGMDVNRYIKKKQSGMGENAMLVADEVEVVIAQQVSSVKGEEVLGQ